MGDLVLRRRRLEHPPLPVTEDTVWRVAAGFKAGGYCGPAQYFSRARQEHLRQVGAPIDAAAEQAITDCTRSVTRGIGPSSLKHSFPFEDLAPRVAWPEVAQLVATPPEGPLFPVALLVVGCWWLCRSIELAAATVGDVTLAPERAEVSLALPVSKTDPKALGTSRTHGCLCCVEKAPLAPLCPFHFLTCRCLTFLKDFFSWSGQDRGQCPPLFPTASGGVLSKAQVVHAMREGIAATGASGVQRQRVGEHVARVAGAQALARAGVDVSVIELIGRWGSSAVRCYVQQAALAVQPLVAVRLARGAAVSAELLASQAALSPRLLAPGRCAESCAAGRPAFRRAGGAALRPELGDRLRPRRRALVAGVAARGFGHAVRLALRGTPARVRPGRPG